MNLKSLSKNILYLVFYAFFAFYSYLMILITLQYIPIDFNVAFLRIKDEETAMPFYQLAFFTHVYTSIFVLFAGAFQFIPFIRKRFRRFHKTTGYFYITLLLLFAAPSGLVMSFYANGGFYSKMSFIILGILWIWFTLKALIAVKKRDWEKHQKFMIRSFALTLSAISLRLFKTIIVTTYGLPPMDTYKIVAWLGWVFNLLIAELIIFIIFKKNLSKNTV